MEFLTKGFSVCLCPRNKNEYAGWEGESQAFFSSVPYSNKHLGIITIVTQKHQHVRFFFSLEN